MARICIAFYNGMYDETDETIMPCWYEVFLNGLRKHGNELLVYQIPDFIKNYGKIDEKTKEEILQFDPDLYITFNNVFYDVSFLQCPILIYSSDSPLYWSNLERISKPNPYIFLMPGVAEGGYLKQIFHIPDERVHLVRPFTEVRADESVQQDFNLSFIGSRFTTERAVEVGNLAAEDVKAREEYARCLEYVRDNPYATKEEVLERNRVENPKVKEMISIPAMVMMLSAEKRIHVLSAVSDLGLRLYGTDTWMSRYHFDARLNFAYVNQKVYSLEHNEEIYNRSKIGINISHYQAKDCFSWRVLDVMASNACIVSDAWSGVGQRFPSLNLPIYQDEYEARTLCQALLKDATWRWEIVEACHKIVDKEYRLIHHLRELEEITGVSLRGEQSYES